MIFKRKNLKDWQEQVWEAKEKIYQETEGMNFKEYLSYIHQGAERFLAEGDLKEQLLPDGCFRIVKEKEPQLTGKDR